MSEDGRQATWLILAKGRRIRHWRLRTALSILAISLCSSSVGGLVVGFSLSAPAAALFAPKTDGTEQVIDVYEQRIEAMHRQIEAVTNQQVAERRAMEARIADLLARQRELTERQGRLGNVMQRVGLDGQPVPTPSARPGGAQRASAGLLTREALTAFLPRARERAPTPAEVFAKLDQSLATLDRDQRSSVTAMAADADAKADGILKELSSLGFRSPAATGGPFLAMDQPFDESIDALGSALDKLDSAKRAASRAPIAHPLKGQAITSRFGPRKDPFNRRRAMHSGIDFRAGFGHPVRASGAGTVVKAGHAGGYGRLVEIDHGNGIRTRYAHLNKIRVRKGQTVSVGDRIGDVGSSGRSTGPHLHYEVRKNGKAIDPIRFLRAGKRVAGYL